MKTIALMVMLASTLACGGSDTPAAATGPHDSFDGVWQVTSAAGTPAQQFNFYRAADASLRMSGRVFYPTDTEHISYVDAEKLSVTGSTVTGTGEMTANTNAFTVPLSVTFDSATHFAGTLGAVALEGSR